MEKLPEDRMGMSIRLLLGTGMRSQELLALEPRHISEDGSIIQIRQAINMVKGTATVGLPKSRDSYRDVPVPPNLRWCAIRLRRRGFVPLAFYYKLILLLRRFEVQTYLSKKH